MTNLDWFISIGVVVLAIIAVIGYAGWYDASTLDAKKK